jgi:hypothetical protein
VNEGFRFAFAFLGQDRIWSCYCRNWRCKLSSGEICPVKAGKLLTKERGMTRATQMLAYHGRTALLLGPMPRRAIPAVANISGAIRPLIDVSDLARNNTLRAAAGLGHPAHNKLLETTVISGTGPATAVQRHVDANALQGLLGLVKDSRRGLV